MANEPEGYFDDATTTIVNKIANGDRMALEELVNRYNVKMLRMASRCMRRLRAHLATCDADDAVNGALTKLHQRAIDGALPCVKSSVEFWKMFFSMLKSEIRGALDHDAAIKRGGSGTHRSGKRRQSGDTLGSNARRWGEGISLDHLSVDAVDALLPVRQNLVLAGLELDEFLEHLADPITRRIAMLKVESYTNEQIGELPRLNERTIERRLAAIRARFLEYSSGS
jgi:DNA-directed RNA polymerase specialized sigma24 family protein